MKFSHYLIGKTLSTISALTFEPPKLEKNYSRYVRVCLCVSVCVMCVWVCMCIWLYVCVSVCVYGCMSVCVYVWMCLWIPVCMCVSTRVYVCVFLCVCVMCVWVHVPHPLSHAMWRHQDNSLFIKLNTFVQLNMR